MRAAVLAVALAVRAPGAAPCARLTTAELLRRLDHLVYAVPDLEAGVADLERGLACARRRAGRIPGAARAMR